jgi:drug/metabolite transporter (DMT)-like permease
MTSHTKGIFFAILTALISGFSIWYNKVAVVSGIDPWIATLIKNSSVAMIIGILLLKNSRSHTKLIETEQSPDQRTSIFRRPLSILALLYIGLVGGGIAFLLYFTGLKMIPAVDAGLIHKSQFLWVAILAPFLLAESISWTSIIGFGFLFYANMLFGLKPIHWSYGHMLILGAALLWSLESIAIRHITQTIDAKKIAFIRMGIGSLVVGIAVAMTGKVSMITHISSAHWVFLSGAIVLLTGYVLSWTKALSLAPAHSVAAVLVLSTPITALLSTSIPVFKQPTQIAMLQLGLTVIGVLLISRTSKKNPHTPTV